MLNKIINFIINIFNNIKNNYFLIFMLFFILSFLIVTIIIPIIDNYRYIEISILEFEIFNEKFDYNFRRTKIHRNKEAILDYFENFNENELLELGLKLNKENLKKTDFWFKSELENLLEEDKMISFLKSNETRKYLKENNISEKDIEKFLQLIKNEQFHLRKIDTIKKYFSDINFKKEIEARKVKTDIISSKF